MSGPRRRLAALGDTLAMRLFLLMWGALVLSHLAAWASSTRLMAGPPPPGAMAAERGVERGPPPPGPGAKPGAPDSARPHEPGGPPIAAGPPLPPLPSLPPSLPWPALLLDYGVRLLLIGAAAWWGSRWLARPIARLAASSEALGPALAHGRPPPMLDETHGTAEVRSTAAVFNRMAAQIRALFEARALLVAAISHDLRTPLTRMRLRVETAAIDDALRQRCSADLREMDSLIGSVLDAFRGHSTPLALQRTDITALVQALVDDREELGAKVALEAPPSAPLVGGTEPSSLRRVVANLVDNALRHAGHAQLRLLPRPGGVEIVVEDRGPGIPPAQLQAVLEPLVRVGATPAATSGTGLGLHIARELAIRLGGELRLANREGGGLRASVTLPLH